MEIFIGQVIHYYNHSGVAVIALEGELRIGDTLIILGHTTDLSQLVCSIEVEHNKLTIAEQGMLVAVKVEEAVRPGDLVYKLGEEADNPDNRVLWKSMHLTLDTIQHTYEPVFTRFMHTNGVDDQTIGILLAAYTFDPGTISPEKLQVRGPYTAAQAWMRRLFTAAGKGYLSEPEPGEFRLSRHGRMVTQKLIDDAREAMWRADPLSAAASQLLAQLLGKLVQACLFSPPPPDTWSIRLAYQLMPPEESLFPYIDQALSCLQAFRDDAHLAAWRPSGVSGLALEVLTLIWRDHVTSLVGIYDKLGTRGYELHDYQAAVAELRVRGWLEGKDSALQLTLAGKEFRDRVEHDTDQYFFAPWDCLSGQERTELARLLSTVRQAMNKKAVEVLEHL